MIEIEDDDGFAESKRGFRLEIVTGFVSAVEFDRKFFKESLPADVTWKNACKSSCFRAGPGSQ